MSEPDQRIVPFLTFSGSAEEAIRRYVSMFPGSRIVSLRRIGKEDRGVEGKVLHSTFELMGQRFMAMDVEPAQAPEFTWAASLYVECADEEQFDVLLKDLSDGGTVLMGPEAIYELRKVAWVTDRFGVTWQLVWA